MSAAAASATPARVVILLSTYNGAAFLPEQLESFVAQTLPGWVLYWRDDGSTDNTIEILRDFAAGAGQGRCLEAENSGEHLGVCGSFLSLLRTAPEAEAVAFSDQDDVWLPGKLDRALTALDGAGTRPVLYCARQYLVDKTLHGVKLSPPLGRAPEFPACLTQNVATGNTVVLNAAAAACVAAAGCPRDTIHDWWSFIVVSACDGKLIFDDQPQVLYRLHGRNLIGRKKQPLLTRAWAAVRRGPMIYMTMMRRHVEALLTQTCPLSPSALADLRLIQAGLQGGLHERVAALRCRHFRRRTVLENVLFFYWFLTNRRFAPAALPGWSPTVSAAKHKQAL